MKLLIFSDIDGTFLNHENYSHGNLKEYLDKIKNNSYIIFNTSKTFNEVDNLNKKLELNFPFIVENGACIFFPKNWLKFFVNTNELFEHKDHYGYRISKYNVFDIRSKLINFKKYYNFSFYSEISDEKLKKITNLRGHEIKRSKDRMFTDPILWEDTHKKIVQFREQLSSSDNSFNIFEGGRFLHISDHYDKALAMKKFISITSKFFEKKYLIVSLGDSQNDIGMLEYSDYSCIVKRENYKISIKKKKKYLF